MQIHRDIDRLPAFRNAVITIGTFDGVHEGHRQIIRKITSLAEETGGESVIITFSPHPRNVINPDHRIYILTTTDEKLELLRTLHVDHVAVVPFSREFSEMDAEEYIRSFLIEKFHPKIIVFGYDHKFGKNRSGDIHLLRKISAKENIRVEEISEQMIHNVTVSSTRIREALLKGDITTATELLGYGYALTGLVVKGDQIGRQLGYPTANMHIDDENKLVPADGVYAVYAHVKNQVYPAMMNIGMRPTFDGKERRLEVNILDFGQDIYGEKLTVTFHAFIRPDKKFNSREELIAAIDQDKVDVMKLFGI